MAGKWYLKKRGRTHTEIVSCGRKVDTNSWLKDWVDLSQRGYPVPAPKVGKAVQNSNQIHGPDRMAEVSKAQETEGNCSPTGGAII